MAGKFRFSFGPWNVEEGSDPFGPQVRRSIAFNKKLALYKKLGFDGIQLHDDDAVPELDQLTAPQIIKRAKALRKQLAGHGLQAEFVAPRLWEDSRTIDGGYTSNTASCRAYAIERSKRCIDIAEALGTSLMVIWFAREGTYLREAKDSKLAIDRLVKALDIMLAYNPGLRIAIEPKPNEPMDQSYIPTTGHAIALGFRTAAPERMGVNIESAHAVLAGLDPSDEMGFALSYDKLWTVHLNDQNGLKFDQDRAFGAVDLRRAFNQVRILDAYDYGRRGEFVGLDVKALRSQKDATALEHLSNSRRIFTRLLQIARGLSAKQLQAFIAARNYEALELYIIKQLIG